MVISNKKNIWETCYDIIWGRGTRYIPEWGGAARPLKPWHCLWEKIVRFFIPSSRHRANKTKLYLCPNTERIRSKSEVWPGQSCILFLSSWANLMLLSQMDSYADFIHFNHGSCNKCKGTLNHCIYYMTLHCCHQSLKLAIKCNIYGITR